MYSAAIITSIRRAASIPSVTAGLKCPEIRISALTKTASTRPCASATSTSAELLWVMRVAMIAPLPTKTRAKVPMNSARKWRQESRITRPLKKVNGNPGAINSNHSAQNQRSVDSTEAERVGEHVLNSLLPPCSRQKIKIAGFVRNLKVNCRRQPFTVDCERANRRLDRAGSAECVAVVTLRPAEGNFIGAISQHLLDRQRLSAVVERRRAPVSVHVVDLVGRHFRVLERQPHRARGLRSIGPWRGHVIGIVGHSVAKHLGVDRSPTRFGALVFLEYQDGRAFSHYEAIAILVEWTRSLLGIFVACRHRANQCERAKSERRQRRFCSAGDHNVRVTVADLPERVPDRDRAGCAAHRICRIRPHRAELNRDVAARCSTEHSQRKSRIDPAQPLSHIVRELTLGVADATESGTHVGPHALAIFPGQVEIRVGKRHLGADDRKLRKPIESLGALCIQMICRYEVVDLCRVVTAEWRRIKTADRPNSSALALQSLPETVTGSSDRCDRTDSG